ncbi:MAG TPA: 30S ribosomal protein S4 [Candidatus Marinimicrobia bacterium]|mgnify:CR=1 FL=1|jgi:small subunit ribosomal protein S4|nr:30S ribosomal protein S4 [Candidatus Neomarinimicrobiota bacterium]MDP6275432.1 30S ribosomal protein S4 [Candidatus Neomarinimicrobiota bacterium]MDP7217103.1 30S ribosomal protein S4 [Candidatus Neomarinimicrobiota bacterium]HJL75184.1 30S ribosomal protein S4 [Candidatus Neomarinimicrobiota bacterium]HJM70479.1 30S ribosomal protein S4 [Candidatus Neomarinimicrobiota bacterium]|tara:strand:- start:3031 stop:3648 length:618 start_codon:yes stop_codon:yes gene_type:complete
MAKLNTPRGKLVRKFGENIFGNPKFDRLLNRKPYAPGQHGQSRRRRLSNYGTQLREKQKIKILYGVLEKQFRNYFEKADKMTGETGTNLMQLLERRLDNVVYRLGFASTRSAARQLVNHGHFLVNNRKVNISSFSVKPGDVIQVRERSKKMDVFLDSMKRIKGDLDLPWLELDKAKMTGTVIAVPERENMQVLVNEQLVVELYSK